MLEMALILSVSLPLLLGVAGVGVREGLTIGATQVTRDVAHLYALGTDFSLPGAQAIARTLSQEFDLSSTGNAVLMLSRIVKVYQLDCNAASLKTCPNLNQPVFAQRIVIGKSTLRSSAFGTPPAKYIDTSGNIKSTDYCQQPSLIASGFGSVLSLQQGQSAWMVEGYYSMPNLDLMNVSGAKSGGYYVRFVF